MADYVKSGAFSTPTNPGTVTAISEASLGFTPKLVLLFPIRAPDEDTAVSRFGFGLGQVGEGSSGKGATAVHREGGGSGRREANGTTNGAGVLLVGNSGAIVVAGVATITPGVGLEVTYSAVDAVAYPVWWIAIGGDDVVADVGYATTTGRSLSFEPQLALAASTDIGEDAGYVISLLGIGVSDGATHGNVSAEDNFISDAEYAAGYVNGLPGRLIARGFGNTERVPTFSSGGISWPFGTSTNTARIASLAGLERGIAVREFQKETSGTNGATQTLPDFGFVPGTILLLSASRSAKGNPDTSDPIGRLTLGLASQADQRSAIGSMASSGNGGDATKWKSDRALLLGTDAETPAAEGRITTWAAEPVITWDVASTSADWIVAVAFEEDPPSGLTLQPDSPVTTSTGHVPALELSLAPDSPATTSEGHAPAVGLAIAPDSPATTSSGHVPAIALSLAPDSPAATSQGHAPQLGLTLAPDSPAATSLGHTPSISTGWVLSPDSPAATSSGHTPALELSIAPDSPAATSQGHTPTITAEAVLSPDSPAATSQGHTPTLELSLAPDSPAATSQGHTPSIVAGSTLAPDSPASTSSGHTPALELSIAPDSPAATSSGHTPAVGLSLGPDSPGATSQGHAPTLALSLAPDSPAATSQGHTPSLSAGIVLSPSSPAATSSGHTPALVQSLSPDSPAATSQGHTPIVARSLSPDSPAATSTGHAPTFELRLAPDSPAATSQGHTPLITAGLILSPDSPPATSSGHTPFIWAAIPSTALPPIDDVRATPHWRAIVAVSAWKGIIAVQAVHALTIGDTAPALVDALTYTDGSPLELNPADVVSVQLRFLLPASSTAAVRSAELLEGWKVRYQWQPGDTAATQPGPLKYQWFVTLADGRTFRASQHEWNRLLLQRAI